MKLWLGRGGKYSVAIEDLGTAISELASNADIF